MTKTSLGAKIVLVPTPVLVVASYDDAGRPNMMTAAWGGVCCSEPPCVTVSIRPSRYSFDCIMKRKAFTVNVPSIDHVREVDLAGIKSGRDIDKFAEANLTAVKSDLVDAPYIAEFPLSLECKLVKTVELGIHTMFVGEILDAKADDLVLGENGKPELTKIRPITFSPSDVSYYATGSQVARAFDVGKPR